MKKISILTLVILLLASCDSDSTFGVTGEVTGAEGKKLYLEASQLGGIIALDSVKLKSNGSYNFKHKRPESPEFYRLRIENRIINFSIDSTETVIIDAPFAEFSTGYIVKNSPNSEKIKELTQKQIKLQNEVNSLVKTAREIRMRNDILQDSLLALLEVYKQDVRTNYIYRAPNTAGAYFALFQKVNDFLIFDPLTNREDVRSFAAVATSLNTFYPHAERTKHLHNLAIKGMKNTRPPKEQIIELDESKIQETSIIDIELKDSKGNVRKLTDLKGKVVLLDFTAYQSAAAAAHNFWLRDLYDMYNNKGLEIYQVSLDADEHFWKTSAANLSWICVRDPRGIYSSTAAIYNVQQVPTYFLVSRDNELKRRSEDIKDIHAELKALL